MYRSWVREDRTWALLDNSSAAVAELTRSVVRFLYQVGEFLVARPGAAEADEFPQSIPVQSPTCPGATFSMRTLPDSNNETNQSDTKWWVGNDGNARKMNARTSRQEKPIAPITSQIQWGGKSNTYGPMRVHIVPTWDPAGASGSISMHITSVFHSGIKSE